MKNAVIVKSMKPIPYVSAVPRKYRSYIRNKAIDRARTRIIVAGNDPKLMSAEDLEVVVREEEDKIKSAIRDKGLLAVLALLGLNLFN
ncbi:hypothetical protein GCM10008090_23410 [Arenicella chitinivorans]|uniref:Uncharacterized protein n=1 Tax=Arenicella chitinivorans TaxID=1329800 RepID=A0A918VNR9_9GAMM|nr:hypothetical protein [Arenicella chitinivorans]GHA13029.1 hypothetical protein GCM10008090_23410 [Arenicella chitinivorans]